MRTLPYMLCLISMAAFAQTPEVATESSATAACDERNARPEGPLAIGFFEADVAIGRRACPRTEVGLGGRFAAIIDTPDFYGALNVNGLVFASWAMKPDIELFATLEAVTYNFAQNAVLTSKQITLGNLTAGASWAFIRHTRYTSALTGRLLLPTSFEIPGARLLGAELGDAASWHATSWLEVHGYLGADFSVAASRAAAQPRIGGVVMVGAQLSPVEWGALVVDVTGRLGPTSMLAASAGLRFRISRFGIELGGAMPLVGTDRHDFALGGRFSWRID